MRSNTHSQRYKGSVYVFVLSTALLVTGVGLGALQAVRVERRTAGLNASIAQARLAALSFVEVALLRISNDPTWRFTYTHNVWTAPEAVGNVTYTFKLVDAQDSDLTDDATEPVRLYAKATVGDAVRIFSVLLRSDEDASYTSTVPGNGDMENGVTPWSGVGCDLEIHTDNPPEGAAYLWVKNRDGTWDGPRQDIADDLIQGVTYEAEVWVKLKDNSEDIRLVLWMDTDSSYYSIYYVQASVGTSWTKLSGTVTPTWTGTLEAAWWEVETSLSNQELMIDDAVMKPLGSDFDMSVAPGTWRREVLP